MSQMRKCCNCGPGAPSKTDERWLCEQCATIYAFNEHGGMFRQPRPGPAAAAVESPREAQVQEIEERVIQSVIDHWFIQGGESQFGALEVGDKNSDGVIAAILHAVRKQLPPTLSASPRVSPPANGLDSYHISQDASSRVSQEEPRYSIASDWRGTAIFDRKRITVIATATNAREVQELVDAANSQPSAAQGAVSSQTQEVLSDGSILKRDPVAASSLLTKLIEDIKAAKREYQSDNFENFDFYDAELVDAALAALRGHKEEKEQGDQSRVDGVPSDRSLGSTATLQPQRGDR